jgi:hypothetical protein
MGSFASLFPVAYPLGAVPLLIVLSANAPPELRKEFASKIGFYTILADIPQVDSTDRVIHLYYTVTSNPNQ